MFHYIKKTILLLSFTLVFATVPARATIINYYDYGTTAVHVASASLFDEKFPRSLRFSNVSAPVASPDDANLYSLQEFSVDFADGAFTDQTLFSGATMSLNDLSVELDQGEQEFSPQPADTISFVSDSGAANATGNMTHVPLLGPIPEPSIKWLLIGALVALAGLSRGTRGIHESV